jgi:hypothetical protein
VNQLLCLFRFRGVLWTAGKARKEADCWACGKAIAVGEQNWRPLSNGSHRMRRLHNECGELAAKFPDELGPAK